MKQQHRAECMHFLVALLCQKDAYKLRRRKKLTLYLRYAYFWTEKFYIIYILRSD